MAEPSTISEVMGRGNNNNNNNNNRVRAHKSDDSFATSLNINGPDFMEEALRRKGEVVGWYVYGFCTYFVQAFLLPVLFPLMVAQRASPATHSPPPAASCHHHQAFLLYQMLVHPSISLHTKLSPLHWTAISWFVGCLISAPILHKIAHILDLHHHHHHQPLILAIATVTGTFICLLTGLFNTTWLFPLYIIIVIVAITTASSIHTHHLSLIIRALMGHRAHQRPIISTRMSLFSTSFGSLATAFIALFTYHMLRRADHLTSLWVVSIFCGLKWFLGMAEMFFSYNTSFSPSPSSVISLLPRFNPYIIGRIVAVFLSSFSTTCIFTCASLYIVGRLCMNPTLLLSLWMIYFVFSALFLPTLHLVQVHVIQADPVNMNVLGFLLSGVTSGLGFYFKERRWHWAQILMIGVVQSAAAGILNAYGRVMVLDRLPEAKEGLFSSVYEWVKVGGACLGFAMVAVFPDDIRRTFGLSFVAVVLGILVLVFGRDVGGYGGGGGLNQGQNGGGD